MRIDGIRTLSGPNIYSHNPVLVMRLYLEDLFEKESYEIPGFVDRLLDLLPGMREHHCSLGREGGFVERLREGTYFGHIVEHVALELTEHAGVPSFHGKTREADEPGCYNVVVEYKAEKGTRFLLETAVELVEALVRGEDFPLEERLKQARSIIAETEFGPTTRAILEAAERRDIPWVRINGDSLVQLGYGKCRRFVQAAMSDRTSCIAVEIAADKELTKKVLSQSSIPVPRGVIAVTEAEAIEAFRDLGAPVVVKPLNGCQGRGVSLNLTSEPEVADAFRIAREFSKDVLVEELFEGRNYRVLVVGGSMVAASERLPAHVTGDGSRTISELIDILNEDPLRGDGHEKPLTKIKVDPVMSAYLKKRGLSLDDVPARGEVVYLREGINLSTGGTAIDVTDAVHPEVAKMCERAARVIGMDICGVDLVLKDISEPLSRGGVIEVNASPGIRMHHFPSRGQARNVGAAIVEMLYPEGSPSRIPLISVTGTNGKTTVTRMIAHVLGETGRVVGMTTTDGIYIGKERIVGGDTTGPQSARTVLADPSVEVAVLETARGGIARRGLGYDWSDISVLTNIQPDHIGQDGIKSIDDLVYIKSLVAERVKEGGSLILNADDERLSRLMDEPRVNRLKRNVIYFSLRENHLLIRRHVAAGGVAYFARGGWIMEAVGRKEYHIVRVANIPATLSGTAEFNVANALAAIAACRAFGMSKEQVAASMKSFAIGGDNPGRMNLYRVGSGYVMVDYAHNSEAIKSICRMASQWGGRRVTGVIAAPGDRNNLIIEQAGRAAAGFHRVIIKEDLDLRGRARGEVPALLRDAVKDEAPDREVSVIPDEEEALRTAMREMGENEVVVVFYEKLERVMKVLEEFGAVSIPAIEAPARHASLARV
ncbi:MAG TPA: cyanophycin synthetase [Blastocatellia bacterium]|nr:cyanophycin synthetase [Blastocatellia bacterium]